MIQIAMALAHLHNGRSRPPCEQIPLVISFPLPHSRLKVVVHINGNGNAMLTYITAYVAASRILQSYTRLFPNQESSAYQSAEFLKADDHRVPTKKMDVYGFGSTLYTVREHPESISH